MRLSEIESRIYFCQNVNLGTIWGQFGDFLVSVPFFYLHSGIVKRQLLSYVQRAAAFFMLSSEPTFSEYYRINLLPAAQFLPKRAGICQLFLAESGQALLLQL